MTKPPRSDSAGLRPLFRATRTLLGDRWNRLFLLAGMSVVSAMLEVTVLYLVALIATGVASGGGSVVVSLPVLQDTRYTIDQLLGPASILLLMLVALAYPVARSAASLSRIGLTRTRSRLLEAYLDSEWASRSTDKAGHIQTLVAEYGMRSENLVLQAAMLVVSLSSLGIIVIASITVAPFAAAVSLLGLTVVAGALRPLSRRVKRRSRELARANKELASRMAEISGISQEIAAFSVAESVKRPLKEQVEKVGAKLIRVRTIAKLVPNLFQYAALGLVLAVVAILSTVSPAGLVTAGPVIIMLIRALGYSKQAQTAIQAGNAGLPYAEAIEAEIRRLTEHRTPPRSARASGFERLEMDGVSFAYPGRPAVLQDVNLAISHGETVGIVGPSGGGKSTLVQLLLRLQKPMTGSIRIDGKDLHDIDDRSWAELIAFVPQDNQLVYGTIAENIRFYRHGYGQREVEAAAQAAHLHDEIIKMPVGYETVVGSGGANLSGGQRQRLGIARAMLGHPAILVLDEPTSALDERSEHLLKATLEEIQGRQTLIVVAHRPSTLQICERLLLVESGHITPASGSSALVREG